MVWFENALYRIQPGGEQELADTVLRRFYRGQVPTDIPGAFRALLRFYRGPRPEPKTQPGGRIPPRAYDYGADGALLAAAFRQAYGIDLTDPALRLHWWTFCSLMDGLPTDCAFCRVVGYRTADTRDMPDKTRQLYESLKKRYALPAQIGGEKRTYASKAEWDAAFLARRRG